MNLKRIIVTIAILLLFLIPTIPSGHASPALSLDGDAGQVAAIGSGTTSLTAGALLNPVSLTSLTPAKDRDLFILTFAWNLTFSQASVQNYILTSNPALDWKFRTVSIGSTQEIMEFYSIEPVSKTLISVTINFNGASVGPALYGFAVFAVSGEDTLHPFDTSSPGYPFLASGNSGSNVNYYGATFYPNEMLTGMYALDSLTTTYPLTGLTAAIFPDPSKNLVGTQAGTVIEINGIYGVLPNTRSFSLFQASGNFLDGFRNVGIADAIIPNGALAGGGNPMSQGFTSVPGPGGVGVPPQIADQGVLSFIGIISGIILLSSVDFKTVLGVSKKKRNRFT